MASLDAVLPLRVRQALISLTMLLAGCGIVGDGDDGDDAGLASGRHDGADGQESEDLLSRCRTGGPDPDQVMDGKLIVSPDEVENAETVLLLDLPDGWCPTTWDGPAPPRSIDNAAAVVAAGGEADQTQLVFIWAIPHLATDLEDEQRQDLAWEMLKTRDWSSLEDLNGQWSVSQVGDAHVLAGRVHEHQDVMMKILVEEWHVQFDIVDEPG